MVQVYIRLHLLLLPPNSYFPSKTHIINKFNKMVAVEKLIISQGFQRSKITAAYNTKGDFQSFS